MSFSPRQIKPRGSCQQRQTISDQASGGMEQFLARAAGRAIGGFTILEATAVIAGIALMAVAVYSTMTRINDFATANRLNSLSCAVLTDQMEQMINAYYQNPGNPVGAPTAAILSSGTSSVPVAIYVDPDLNVSGTSAANLQVSNTGSASLSVASFSLITGTMTKVVSDITPYATGSSYPVYMKQVNLTLNYNFRGRKYQANMDLLRVPSSF